MSDPARFVVTHKDGVGWWEMPTPPYWHRCHAQTTSYIDGRIVDRCPCGAMAINFSKWMERNQTRKADRKRWWRR